MPSLMMQTFIQNFAKLPSKNFIFLAFGISLLTILSVLGLKSFLPPEVPLFYGRPVGEAQLTKTLGLAIAPAISILILAVNTIISIMTPDILTKKILIISSFVISLITSITVIRIILLVAL